MMAWFFVFLIFIAAVMTWPLLSFAEWLDSWQARDKWRR